MSLWTQFRDFARQLLSLSRDNQANKEALQSLREDNRELRRDNAELRLEMNTLRTQVAEMSRLTERMLFELQRTRDRSDSDLKLLRQEFEILLLRRELHSQEPPPGLPRRIADQDEA